MKTASKVETQARCPSCRTRLPPGTTACPICGHVLDVAVPDAPAPPADVTTASPVVADLPVPISRAARFGRWLARLPWGVFGVIAVIGALVAGAAFLLRGGAVLPRPPEPTLVPATATAAPTFTPAPTATPLPTATPILPTPTLPPRAEVVVQPGDTCSGIADRYRITIGELIRYNNLDATCFLVAGNLLLIPPAAPTPGPTPTRDPNATAAPAAGPTATLPPVLTYEVRQGDVCGTIAERFRITVLQIIQQNNLDANCSIRVGQQLTFRFSSPTPAATNTPFVAATPTPRTGYSAPTLLSPGDGAAFTETQDVVTLQWLTVGTLKPDEWYVVHVQPSGAITVPLFETKGTSLKLTRDLLGAERERAVAWWIEIKRVVAADAASGIRAYADISPPSAVRRFTWRRPIGTPTP